MTFFEDITTSNAISQLERILLDIEKRWKIHITIHDHKGLLCLPDGHHILPHRNVHQNICCRWKARQPDVHSRCLAHCKTGAIRLLTENPVPTQTICWRFLTEVIVPIHRGREHVATFFGGTFRLPDSQLPERGEPQDNEYWRLYRTLPEWSDSCGNEISLLLQMVGAGFLQIANRLYEEYLNQSGRAGHIRRFINYYANTDTRLKDLAKYLGLSESRTSHLLKQTFGCSFHHLLNQQRIRHAKSLLYSRNLSMQEIAEQVGFSNEFYFNRIFKKIEGVPPGILRRQILNPPHE